MTQILNSQSDAIVVVNTDKKPHDLEIEEADMNALDLLFYNSKSVKLFEFDMTEDKQPFLNLPQFVPIDKEMALKLEAYKPDDDWLNELREKRN